MRSRLEYNSPVPESAHIKDEESLGKSRICPGSYMKSKQEGITAEVILNNLARKTSVPGQGMVSAKGNSGITRWYSSLRDFFPCCKS